MFDMSLGDLATHLTFICLYLLLFEVICTNICYYLFSFVVMNRCNAHLPVHDNLRGQCTHGHSCKESSLEKLQRTIDIYQEELGGIGI